MHDARGTRHEARGARYEVRCTMHDARCLSSILRIEERNWTKDFIFANSVRFDSNIEPRASSLEHRTSNIE